jgi:hypothetical protein
LKTPDPAANFTSVQYWKMPKSSPISMKHRFTVVAGGNIVLNSVHIKELLPSYLLSCKEI